MSITIRETLRNPSTGETRVTYDYKGLVAVVKVFDPSMPKDYVTVKFFLNPKHYEVTAGYWNTIEAVDDEVVERLAKSNLEKVLRRIQNIKGVFGEVRLQ